ncbi:hypothetical protein [Thermocrinis jamiesonii]|jgi:hypothetical protein|uniref:hypothetical protein n=1 Tax=Thermocrinis jamiesonii TaxID=1302351 RepID=UPI0004954F36|nr:hypothetical protein [Thermocrinis jamiesonii]
MRNFSNSLIKKLRIEDLILGSIVALALFYPIIIAVIIYKSESRSSDERLKLIVEYLQSEDCKKHPVKKLTEVCKKIKKEGYSPRDSKIEKDKAILVYGKKVKGLEKKLVIEINFEGDEIASLSYEERD